MVAITAITGFISVVVGWLVTARLFALTRQTGALPERLLAVAFGGLFCVGYPLGAVSRSPSLVGTYEGALLFTIAMLGIAAGLAALNRFPQVVFHAGQPWAILTSLLATTIGIVGALGCAVAVATSGTRAEMVAEIQPWAITLMLSIVIPFTWNGIDSWRYYRNMKKRLPLGLADPVTTHRFLLWTLASGISALQVAIVVALRATGMAVLSPIPMTIIAMSSLLTSLCWALAFFMPARYETFLHGGVRPESSTPR